MKERKKERVKRTGRRVADGGLKPLLSLESLIRSFLHTEIEESNCVELIIQINLMSNKHQWLFYLHVFLLLHHHHLLPRWDRFWFKCQIAPPSIIIIIMYIIFNVNKYFVCVQTRELKENLAVPLSKCFQLSVEVS